MTDPDELPSDAFLRHLYCRCPLLPIEEDAVPNRDNTVLLRRARTTLSCEAGGCGVTYTYLGREHESFGPEVQCVDVAEARRAAAAWGWTTAGGDDRCPRHPADEHFLDSGD